ncbi:MAG: hypothetical protein PHQ92_02360 [Petrimonas sp.]|jgi:hypothetical protein|nr:hypothetical protein [Petrimonas sp.]
MKQYLVGRLIPLATLIFILLYNLSAGVTAQVNNKKCIVETREYPGLDFYMWDGLYAASNGEVYTGLITENVSANFYVYSPLTNKNIHLYDIAKFLNERGKGIRTSGKIHNKPVEDKQGNIYFVPLNNGSGPRVIDYTSWEGGHWLKYDPKTKVLSNLGLVDDGLGCYPLTIDKERNYLFGVGFTGYLYRFDINQRVTKNLGRVSNWDVCRDIFCDDQGNVYGCFPIGRIWKYDAKTEKVIDLSIELPHDPNTFPTQLLNPMIDRSYDWRSVEWDSQKKVAYGVTCGSGSILFRFDPYDGKEGKIEYLVKMCDGKFLEPGRQDVPYSTLAFAVDSKNQKIYYAPSSREYALDKYTETFEYIKEAGIQKTIRYDSLEQRQHLIMYDIKADKRVDLGVMQTKEGYKVFGCEAASVNNDGKLYICGQVEVSDPDKATSYVGDVPVSLQLIIYNPN